jgi:hypothetical protein
MTAYVLALILIVGVPFHLYCLWNFGRELWPRRSRATLSARSFGPKLTRPMVISGLSRPAHAVPLLQNHRTAS